MGSSYDAHKSEVEAAQVRCDPYNFSVTRWYDSNGNENRFDLDDQVEHGFVLHRTGKGRPAQGLDSVPARYRPDDALPEEEWGQRRDPFPPDSWRVFDVTKIRPAEKRHALGPAPDRQKEYERVNLPPAEGRPSLAGDTSGADADKPQEPSLARKTVGEDFKALGYAMAFRFGKARRSSRNARQGYRQLLRNARG